MPQVPVYGDRQIRTQALQPVMQQTPDVSSGARALAQGLGQVAEAADRIDLRDSQDAAFKAQSELRNAWQDQRAALREQYKGDQAGQYKTAAEEWWKEAKNKYTQSLNPRAQALAGRALGEYKAAQDNDTLAYVENEKTRSREINFRTLQDRLVFETGQNVNAENAEAMSGATANALRKNAIEYAAANGFNSDVAEGYVREYTSKMHTDVAVSLARTDATAAQSYMNKFGKDLPLSTRNRADDIIKQEGDNQFARVEAARVLAMPPEQQKTELAKITDPVRLQKTQIEMNNALAFAKSVQSQQWSAAAQDAFRLANEGKTVPAVLRARMDQENDVPKLDNLIKTRADRLVKGEKVTTDWNTYVDLRQRLFDGEEINLMAYTEKIAGPQMEQLLDVKTKAFKEPEARTSEAQLRTAAAGLKLKGKQLGQFQAAYGEEVNAFIKENGGKKPNYDQRVDILDRLTNDVVTSKGLLWDSTEKGYLLPRDQRKGVSAQTTPAGGSAAPKQPITTLYQIGGDDRQQITEGLRARGQAVTEENIQRVYANWKGK